MSGTLQYAFLSYYRTGFPAMLTAPTLNNGERRARIEVKLQLKEGERLPGDVTMNVAIQGPQPKSFQDLTHLVVRTDPAVPATGTTLRTLATSQFEPN
ncbi:MAG: hypothetical protein ACYSWU_18640, partial [Planctomycetota bacterium]